jgi:hypothetical protein
VHHLDHADEAHQRPGHGQVCSDEEIQGHAQWVQMGVSQFTKRM